MDKTTCLRVPLGVIGARLPEVYHVALGWIDDDGEREFGLQMFADGKSFCSCTLRATEAVFFQLYLECLTGETPALPAAQLRGIAGCALTQLQMRLYNSGGRLNVCAGVGIEAGRLVFALVRDDGQRFLVGRLDPASYPDLALFVRALGEAFK